MQLNKVHVLRIFYCVSFCCTHLCCVSYVSVCAVVPILASVETGETGDIILESCTGVFIILVK
jgi:hypothetical protein